MAGNENSGRRDAPEKRRTVAADGVPLPPDFLNGAARKVFTDRAEILAKEYGAGEIDSDVLALYAQNWALYCELANEPITLKRTTKDGAEIVYANPAVAARNRAESVCMRLIRELGMSPKSRKGLPINTDDDDDEFAEFD